jgi:hypothetical protein
MAVLPFRLWVSSTFALTLSALALAPASAAQGNSKAVQAAQAACAAHPATSTRYVAATSVRLRRLPRAQAEAVSSLPIGTSLQVECQVDGWVRARSEGDAPAVGWTRADLLQDQRPTLEALIAAHAKAPAAQRRELAERAVALAPFDARSHQLLIDTLSARRDRKGVQQATALRERMVNPRGERLGKEPWTLFVVEDGLVNALAIVDGPGRFRDAEQWAPAGAKPGTSPYLLPWRSLHFYRGGGADGVVQVLQAPSAEAIGFFSPVRHPPAVMREPTLDGIASNVQVTTAAAPAPVAPSRTERSGIDRELRQSLKRERVPARAVSSLLSAPADSEQGGVRRLVLPASGKPMLLVTAHWRLPAASTDVEGELLDVVLLLEADGKGTYRVTHRLVQKTVGDGIAHHDFIDQLDVDQDGVAELIFRVGGYEGSDYEIWRRVEGKWTQVFKGAYVGV